MFTFKKHCTEMSLKKINYKVADEESIEADDRFR